MFRWEHKRLRKKTHLLLLCKTFSWGIVRSYQDRKIYHKGKSYHRWDSYRCRKKYLAIFQLDKNNLNSTKVITPLTTVWTRNRWANVQFRHKRVKQTHISNMKRTNLWRFHKRDPTALNSLVIFRNIHP